MSSTEIKQGSKEWKKLRERCIKPIPGRRSALYFFADKILGLGDKIPMTYLAHWPLCLFIEKATGIPEIDSAPRQLIHCPRGLGKSALGANARPTQELCAGVLNDDFEDWAIGVAGETQDLAKDLLGMIKSNFESNELLQNLFPEVIPDFSDTTWKAERIVLERENPRPRSPSVFAAGVNKTITGVHMDKWIVDDMISDDMAEQLYRGITTEEESMRRWVQRLEPTLNSPLRDPITFIGTPWFKGDTYEYVEKFFGGLPERADPDDIAPDFQTIWKLTLPDGQKVSIPLYRRGDLAVFRRPAIENGRSIFPERWTKEELSEMKNRAGSSQFFEAMYNLNPTSGEDTAFDLDWIDDKTYTWDGSHSIRFYDLDGQPKQVYLQDMVTWISCDPAFSDKKSAARTAITVCGTDGKHIFLLENFAEHGLGTYDMAEQIVDFAFQYDPQTVFLETIASQHALVEPIKRTAKEHNVQLHLEEVKSHSEGNKQIRILGLERWFRKGLFYHHPSHNEFRKEYETFPRGLLRDILDSLTFQKSAWERATRIGSQHHNTNAGNIQEGHQRAVERIRQEMS